MEYMVYQVSFQPDLRRNPVYEISARVTDSYISNQNNERKQYLPGTASHAATLLLCLAQTGNLLSCQIAVLFWNSAFLTTNKAQVCI